MPTTNRDGSSTPSVNRRRRTVGATASSTCACVRPDGERACKRDPVHRALSGIRICGHPSVRSTRGMAPERRPGRPFPLFDLAPGGGCRAAGVAPDAGALLPHRCTLACAVTRHRRSLSVALSDSSRRPGSRQHLALWSPDVPRRGRCHAATARPAHRGTTTLPGRPAYCPGSFGPDGSPDRRRRRWCRQGVGARAGAPAPSTRAPPRLKQGATRR